MTVSGKLPYKTVKRILVNELDGKQISKKSVEFIKSYLETEIKEICKNVVLQHEATNKYRKFHGVPELRRYDVSIFKSVVVEGIYSPSGLKSEGEEANSVYPTPLSSEKARVEIA